MKQILLLLDNKTNSALLSAWLKQRYDIVLPANDALLDVPFDLCFIDGPGLDRLWQQVRLRKAREDPTFLPLVLITTQREAELLTRHMWKTVDELIRMPVEKLELQARVEILLRTRQLSLELKLRNEELETFFHALTHDIRAPLRAIKGFTHLLQEEEATRMGVQGQQDLERIATASTQMQSILDGLLQFARVERGERQMQAVALDRLVQRCLDHLEQEIALCQAQVVVQSSLPVVLGSNVLLTIAVNNLISNALKFVSPGVLPIVTLRSSSRLTTCRLEIEDNGIGITSEDQARLFHPFVQLHGGEVYNGVGLGLATVRKAVELMGGRIGVSSLPGQGSIFWLELRVAE